MSGEASFGAAHWAVHMLPCWIVLPSLQTSGKELAMVAPSGTPHGEGSQVALSDMTPKLHVTFALAK
jgi:hypothetical protein